MENRKEYKYLVPNRLLDRLRAEITPFTEIDQYARDLYPHEYTVRSLYYDTPKMMCYQEKLAGIRVRNKYRIRAYNQPEPESVVYFEIKRKSCNCISKNRAPITWKNSSNLLARNDTKSVAGKNGNIFTKDLDRFLYNFHRRHLRPVILIVYEREARHGKFTQSLRLTFDKNLRSIPFPSFEQLYDDAQFLLAMRQHFIMEVKFSRGVPDWLKSIVQRYQLPRLALSKYTICIDSHQENNILNSMRMQTLSDTRLKTG